MFRFLREPRVGQERQHPEQNAQDILALGNPGHRLDPQRVEAEEGRDRETAPKGAGQLEQDHENKDGIDGMQQDVGEMITHGVESPKQVIQHERPLGERMPIGSETVSESPAKIG